MLKREDKYFVVDINGRRDTVSLDRLKAAHIEQPLSDPGVLPTPTSGTQTGQQPTSSHVSLLLFLPPRCWDHLHLVPLARDAVSTGLDNCRISFPSSSLGGEYCGEHLNHLPNC